MPGMTDQQQRDMEAQFRADLAAARRERDAFRARLENAEVVLREIRATSREYDGVASTAARYNRCLRIVDAALAEVGQERQRLVCSACGRASDTEPRGGLCGMPRPPLGICCGRFRVALGAVGEEKSDARSV